MIFSRSLFGRVALCVALAGIAFPAAGLAAADVEQDTPSDAAVLTVDASGLKVVKGVSQPHPKTEAEAQAISDAQVFAEEHAADVGYPWFDPNTQELFVSSANAKGRDALAGLLLTSDTKSSVRDVARSLGELASIADAVTRLNEAGVADADLIYATVPDYKNSVIGVFVSRASTRLFNELVHRFGTDAIVLIIDSDGFGGGSTASRLHDSIPYYGGASIGCPTGGGSDAFAWTTNYSDHNALVTVGHCAPSGGSPTIDGAAIGTITASSGENWSSTNGTQYFTGQSTYRGDVGLIRLASGRTSAASIFRGPYNSSTSSPVTSILRRYSYPDENVYVGGSASGETGFYHILDVGVNVLYSSDGPNVWARNVVRTYVLNGTSPCIKPGDSGGSVFRTNSTGVTAVGVQSGFWSVSLCNMVFTDIQNVFVALPGDILLN